jgi:hypothetical protein
MSNSGQQTDGDSVAGYLGGGGSKNSSPQNVAYYEMLCMDLDLSGLVAGSWNRGNEDSTIFDRSNTKIVGHG